MLLPVVFLAAWTPLSLFDVWVYPSRGPGETGGRRFFRKQKTSSDDKEAKLLGVSDISGGDRLAFATNSNTHVPWVLAQEK